MKSPAFQFYPAEFLSDENVVMMSNQEIGCYMKLMCFCWREGSIPSNITRIAKLCGEDGSAMAQLWVAISSCFDTAIDDASRLVHPRLEKERIKQIEYKKERSESGTKGAEARWSKPSKANSTAIAKPIAEPIANDASSSSPSSSSSLKSKPLSEYSDDFLIFWKLYPEKTGKGEAFKSWKKTKPVLVDVVKALEWQLRSKKWAEGYIPLPATYLNQLRWQDEPQDVINGTSKPWYLVASGIEAKAKEKGIKQAHDESTPNFFKRVKLSEGIST